MKTNKHGIGGKDIEKYILTFVLVLVLFKIITSLWPTMSASGDELNASGFPLGELFVSSGALWYLIAAAVIFLIYRSFSVTGK